MKKTNKNNCIITRLWPTLEDMKKDLFIDLEKEEVINLLTKKKLNHQLSFKEKKEKGYYKVSFSKHKKTYQFLLHRLFFYWHHGYLPKLVDHKDTNSLNNKIENLRELNSSGNGRNTKKTEKKTSSKYKGVYWHKRNKKWMTKLKLNRKTIYIGIFDNEDDAGQAYNDAIRKYGLEEASVMNDTPQERTRKNNLFEFDPLPPEMNHIRDLFKNLEPLVDFK